MKVRHIKTACCHLFIVAITLSFSHGAALAKTVYLPHMTGYSTDWWTHIVVDNTGDEAASFSTEEYYQESPRYSSTYTVGPFEQKSWYYYRDIAEPPECAKITFSSPHLSIRAVYESDAGGLAEFMLDDTLSSTLCFYFSIYFSDTIEWKGLAFSNMGTSTVDVTLTAMGDGKVLGTDIISNVRPNEHISGTTTQWFPGVDPDDITRVIASSSNGRLSGIAIAGDMSYEKLLFTKAEPVSYQPRTIMVSSIRISGAATVNEDSGAQYSCTAYYSDGTNRTVTASASWSENSSFASISSSGYLNTSSVSSDKSCTITATYGGKTDTHTVTIKNQAPAVTLTSISISGPGTVNEDSGAQYTCTAHYSDGTTSTVTSSASWSENSSYASISSSGYLNTASVSSDKSCTITAGYGGKTDTHAVTIKNKTSTSLSGTYTGSYQSTWYYDSSGSLKLVLNQSGTSLSGTLTVGNTECGTVSMSVSGSVSGSSINLQGHTTCQGYYIELWLSASISGTTISGTYDLDADYEDDDHGTFTLTR